MDPLSRILNESKIGCRLNGMMINHIMYADDSCIIASSPSGLQKLLNICSSFALDNTIVYNETKTKFMCFKPRNYSH